MLASFLAKLCYLMHMLLPNLYFLSFELLVLLLFLICLRHAWQGGSWVVWQLLAGVLFGLLLEWATISVLRRSLQQLLGMVLGSVLIFIQPSNAIKTPRLLGALALSGRSNNLRHCGRAHYQPSHYRHPH